MRKTVLITGGAGFIGSHFTEYLLSQYPDYEVRVLDALTYAGRRENLAAVEGDPRFTFIHGDVRDKQSCTRGECRARTMSSTSPPKPM
jgi:dTDP-glucose 4,6-dehydratase